MRSDYQFCMLAGSCSPVFIIVIFLHVHNSTTQISYPGNGIGIYD
jgi:hypothetical protein